MLRQWFYAAMVVVGMSAGARAAIVWQSTFDSTADGVADIYNNDSLKVMIGPVTSGRLQITTADNGTDAYTPDKAGRPLGSTLGAADSFSGLYRFDWSTLNQSETQAYELAGFLGNASPQTRQVMGTILRHWQDSGNYYVGVDLAFGSVGANLGGFGYSAGPAINLGTNPLGQDYQLAVGYDGPSHTLSVGLYDATGNPLIERSDTLEDLLPGTNGEATEISSTALTNLGWSDYSANLTDQTTVWQNDSLTYFNTANGAHDAAVPEPASLALAIFAGVPLIGRRRRAC